MEKVAKAKKKVWHVFETPDELKIFLKGDEGDETIVLSKKDADFDKKVKEYAKREGFEMLRKHYKLHHRKNIIEEEGEKL